MKRDTDDFKFTVDANTSLYRGFYKMDKLRVSHQTFEGSSLTIEREMMDRHDAVCILLVDLKAECAVFIEQFRVGALREDNPWLLELVAGLIDKEEEPEEVGRREAVEEAGLTVGRTQFITRYLPSPGGSNERVYLYVGEVDSTNAGGIHGLDEEGEDIRVHKVPFQTAFDWLADGTFNNAASIIALQWLQLNLENLKETWQ